MATEDLQGIGPARCNGRGGGGGSLSGCCGIETLVEGHYAPRLRWHLVDGDCLKVNLFTLVALNFLGIHRAILETRRRLDKIRPSSALPVKTFKDLLVIGASVFFEADRPRNLWRVDEYLSLRFVPLFRRLGLGE